MWTGLHRWKVLLNFPTSAPSKQTAQWNKVNTVLGVGCVPLAIFLEQIFSETIRQNNWTIGCRTFVSVNQISFWNWLSGENEHLLIGYINASIQDEQGLCKEKYDLWQRDTISPLFLHCPHVCFIFTTHCSPSLTVSWEMLLSNLLGPLW